MNNKYTVNNTIIFTVENKISSDELRSMMENDILGPDLTEAAYDGDGFVNIIHKGEYECFPISINKLRTILLELEQSGCNYVSIDFHSDHFEYDFYGAKAHTLTEDELKREEELEKKKMIMEYENHLNFIDKKREELIKKIEELKI